MFRCFIEFNSHENVRPKFYVVLQLKVFEAFKIFLVQLSAFEYFLLYYYNIKYFISHPSYLSILAFVFMNLIFYFLKIHSAPFQNLVFFIVKD